VENLHLKQAPAETHNADPKNKSPKKNILAGYRKNPIESGTHGALSNSDSPNLKEESIMKKFSIASLGLAAIIMALSLCPSTKADEWDKKTVVTFDQDVEIPGQVLPAGTYVFKLLRNNSNRNIVQIWTAHESHLLSTLITVGDSFPNPSGDPYFVLDMSGTEEGYPPVVASWFFGGGNEGRDFVYSSYSTTRVVTSQSTTDPDNAPYPQQ
jgi:hypothetical protein